jgi:hypothetical protein
LSDQCGDRSDDRSAGFEELRRGNRVEYKVETAPYLRAKLVKLFTSVR